MIKLDLPNKPAQLTDEVQQNLTDEYKKNGTDVWNKPFIKKAVQNLAFDKCCYSEIELTGGGKYMEIDHFYPKKLFPDKVIEWGNLLPSVKTCNVTKGDYNTMLEPIINPFVDNPKEHLYIENYRFYGKTDLGKLTIEKVALNHRTQFVEKRFEIGDKILEKLEDIKFDIGVVDDKRLFARFIRLLKENTRESEYSASCSTIILESEDFKVIESYFAGKNLLDDEFETIKNDLIFCALPK